MIIQGDCLTVLKTLESKSVNCCVTSPPYYGLRDYGVDGQIGLESTPEEYIIRLVAKDLYRDCVDYNLALAVTRCPNFNANIMPKE